MSFLQLTENDNSQMYIKHGWHTGYFMVGDDMIEVTHFMLDTNFKTGYGKFEDGQYYYRWDEQQGAGNPDKDKLLADGYKRAFEAPMYIKGKGNYVWQRFSQNEAQAFDDAMSKAWQSKPATGDQVPVFEYTGSKKVQAGQSKGFVPLIEFVKWQERPEDFVNMSLDTGGQEDENNLPPEDDIPF
jgi:hypothetical protein